jgi:hypothetical protein
MYYAAHCADLGRDVPIEAAVSKLYAADSLMEMALEAVQCMGGNGVLKIYPVQRILQDAKLTQIAAGTSEVLRLLIYRQGIKRMKADLKVPQRVIDPELQVPLSAGKPLPKKKVREEGEVLQVLAENYRVNPGLHMTWEDLQEWMDLSDEDLAQGLVGLYRSRKGIALARVTLAGLQKAHPPEYYRSIPGWADPRDMF